MSSSSRQSSTAHCVRIWKLKICSHSIHKSLLHNSRPMGVCKWLIFPNSLYITMYLSFFWSRYVHLGFNLLLGCLIGACISVVKAVSLIFLSLAYCSLVVCRIYPAVSCMPCPMSVQQLAKFFHLSIFIMFYFTNLSYMYMIGFVVVCFWVFLLPWNVVSTWNQTPILLIISGTSDTCLWCSCCHHVYLFWIYF